MRMPPLIVYRLNSSTMNGMNSCRIAFSQNRAHEAESHGTVRGSTT